MSRDRPAPPDRAALLGALDRAMLRVSGQSVLFSHAVAERAGMYPTDLECLGFLVAEGPLPAGRLAALTGLTTGAVTRLVDRLEAAGYVRREADPLDRRRVIVRLLPERTRAIAALFEPMTRAMADLYGRYGDQELAVILDFASRAHAVTQEQTARLREVPGVRQDPSTKHPAGERRTRRAGATAP